MLVVVILCLVATVSSSTAMMTGGWKEQNASDPDYMERAWKSMNVLNDNASNNGPYHWMPIKVLSAKSQVVAGAKHEMEVLVGESNIKKGDVSATEFRSANGKLKENPNRALYKVTVWEKPWENFEEFNVNKIRGVEAHEQL